MSMEIVTDQQSIGIDFAFSATDDLSTSHDQEAWSEFSGNWEQTLGIAPYLLTQTTSSEGEYQSAQSEEHSPSEDYCMLGGDASISMEQLRHDTLWPELQPNGFQQQQTVSLEYQDTWQQDTRHCSAGGEMVGGHIEAKGDAPLPMVSPQPVKRKRGRPRLISPMIEGHCVNMSSDKLSCARKLHLEKNRIAAAKCRERSKEYTLGLAARASELSSKNKSLRATEAKLREAILKLKHEVLHHAGCGSWAIDRYVERCAGNILGVEAPPKQQPSPKAPNQIKRLDSVTNITEDLGYKATTASLSSQGSVDPITISDE